MSEWNKRVPQLSSGKLDLHLSQRLREKGSASRNKDSIVRRAGHGPVPLSFAQERLWFLDQLDPNSCVYSIPMELRIQGALNAAVLQDCWNEIVRRHEALRTRFETVDLQPMQVIAPTASLEMPLTDLSSLAAPQREAEAKRLCAEEGQRPFDLKNDLMLRARLFRLAPEDHILFLNFHHIVVDGWSLGVMFSELNTLYAAFLAGKDSPLPVLQVQYADYAVWQRDWVQGQVLEKQLGYWLKQLDGAPQRLELPTDRPRPLAHGYSGATMRLELPSALTSALRDLSRAEGVTFFITLLAGFQTLLQRYTGVDDIVVGSVVGGRNRTEVEGLIGFFVNAVALRGDLSGNPTFRALLQRTRTMFLAAFAHQDLPFEKLVEVMRRQRDASHSPLFQVMVVLQSDPDDMAKLPGLDVHAKLLPTNTAKFDLTLQLREEKEVLGIELEYNTDLFDAASISTLLTHYQTLLEGVVADREKSIADLPLLTEGERHKLVVEWNQTRRDYPRDRCIHEVFEEQVKLSPEAVAVVFEGKSLTYQELNARADRLAQHLIGFGVRKGVLAGLCVERSLEMIVGVLGILKAGGVYWALEENLPAERLQMMLADAKPAVLLFSSKSGRPLPTCRPDRERRRPPLPRSRN